MRSIMCNIEVSFKNSFDYGYKCYTAPSIRKAIETAKSALESRYTPTVSAVCVRRIDTGEIMWYRRNP